MNTKGMRELERGDKVVTYKTPKSTQSELSGDTFFFSGQYPKWMADKSDVEWVKYMNKKYGFKWNGKDK